MPQPVARKRKREIDIPENPNSENKNVENSVGSGGGKGGGNGGGNGGGRRLWDEDVSKEAEEVASKERERDERKRQRKAKKRKMSDAAADDLEKKAAEAEVIIALDMSTSPGLAIVDRSNNAKVVYHLVGFSQTDKQQNQFDKLSSESKCGARFILSPLKSLKNNDKNNDKKNDKNSDKNNDKNNDTNSDKNSDKKDKKCEAEGVVWVRRSPKEGEYEHNTDFYDRITDALMRQIISTITSEGGGRRKRCLAVVEAYAFHIAHSSSITKLAELGGVMRNKLFKAGIPFAEVSPTSIKKWFAGKGSADKPEMWAKFQKVAPEIKLSEWLPAALTPQKIPSPHQDIVDAFAAAHSLHSNNPLKRRNNT